MIGLTLFLLGLLAAKFFTPYIIFLIFICLVVCKIFLKKANHGTLIAFALTCVFMFGIYRGYLYKNKLAEFNDFIGKQIVAEVLSKGDAVYSDRKQLVFSAHKIIIYQPYYSELIGNIEVEGIGEPMVYRGDKLIVKGKLFKKRGDNLAGISFANIEIVKSNPTFIDKIRRLFASGLQNVLPEPMASLGLGILIGQRNTLPEDLIKQLTQTGLVHIVAVSGYNLTIIIYAALRLFQKKSRYQAMIVSYILVILFLMITGFSPSIVRAAVVCILSLLFWYYGRNVKPMMILLISASVTAGMNPLFIWTSVSWYLSFTAFFGILILGPLIHDRFVPSKLKSNFFIKVLTETTAAQICTLPVLLYVFSSLSVVSVLANLLVVPIIPFVMVATLIAGIVGILNPVFIGGLIAIPARIMLRYIVEVANILSNLSFASKQLKINLTQAIVLGGFIVIFTLLLRGSLKRKLFIDRIET